MSSYASQFQIAAKLHTTGRAKEAEPIYRQLLQQSPDDSQVLHLLGLVCFQTGRNEEAADLIQKAIARKDDVADYHSNLGVVLDALRRPEEAAESFKRAIAIKPNYPEAHNNYAGVLGAAGKLDEAIAEYNLAVEQKPDYADAWDNLGSTLRRAMRFDQAMAAYDKAIAIRPNFAYSHYNRGTLKLSLGQMTADAWDDYEWRWRSPTFGHPIRNFGGKPMWDGKEDLSGKSILFHAEQGLGDVLQFVRFSILLAERGAHVIVEAQPELASLLVEVPGVSTVIARGSLLPDFDFHLPMLSITRVLNTTLETIPKDVPYILAPAVAYEEWRQVTRADAKAEGKKKLRVGLTWSSNPANVLGRLKSIKLEQLAPLAAAPNVRFYSLQLGPAAEEVATSPFPVIDHTAKLTDFVQTSGLVSNLDLVISVETSVAHLAGALNHPVWLLTSTPPDWRWMQDRTDSPWYPSMVLYRQEKPGDWSVPIQRIAEKLGKWGAQIGKKS